MWEIVQENNHQPIKFKQVLDLLDELDRSYWESIRYVDLADEWLNIVDYTMVDYDKYGIDVLEEKRKKLLYDYLINNKKLITKTIVNYEIVDDDYEIGSEKELKENK